MKEVTHKLVIILGIIVLPFLLLFVWSVALLEFIYNVFTGKPRKQQGKAYPYILLAIPAKGKTYDLSSDKDSDIFYQWCYKFKQDIEALDDAAEVDSPYSESGKQMLIAISASDINMTVNSLEKSLTEVPYLPIKAYRCTELTKKLIKTYTDELISK